MPPFSIKHISASILFKTHHIIHLLHKCMMYLLSFHSLLPHSITTIVFLLITSPPLVNGDQFSTCINSLYSCGENIKDIGYPFWGGDRPEECGHPDFKLTCDENTNYTTMIFNSQSFRVIDIDNPAQYTMSIARSDLLDDVCPNTSISETRLIDGLFIYLDVENVTLYLDCSSSFNMSQNYSRFEFKCNEDGIEKLGFFADDIVPSSVRDEYEKSCESKIEVPISEIGLKELTKNLSTEFLEVLNQGIYVAYNGSFEYCFACEKSDGICWSGTSLEEPTCLCRDGIYPYYCRLGKGGKRVSVKIGIGIGGTVFWLALICAVLFAYCRRKKRYPYGTEFGRQGSGNGWGCNGGIYKKSLQKEKEEYRNIDVFMEQYGSLAPVIYSYSDIKKMTSSFKHKLGQGGFGEVYKGMLNDGRIVAVKILNSTNENGEDFINEVVSISRTSHVNVVNLLGFCHRGTKRALVYEFMPNGSLERYIHGNNNTHLGWDKLYKIALGIAQGLEYLHKGCNTRIVHFDIKPHNILLDQDFCPKISDFGLAKLCANKESALSMFGPRGTIGYIAPEVVSRNFGSISHKSDVYSYGMMVLEMVGGRKNVNDNVSHSSAIYFPHWAYQRLLLDEDLKFQGVIREEEEEIAKKMILIGFWCIQTDPSDRPSMNKVIEMLVGSLEKLEMPPKPFLYSSSHSEDISSAICL